METPLLKERYQLQSKLGQGEFATTYLALDCSTDRLCVVKHVSLKQARDWKSLELFEREARVLAHLQHPRIPAYIDFFTQETEDESHFYLIQQHIAGQNLDKLIKSGQHLREAEVIEIARQALEILKYLHSFSPPIVHRDIKPSNLLLTSGHEVFLLDFGAVKDQLRHARESGATVAGTFGYMPIEQFEGRSMPASDIYSLGATLVFLLSHREPLDMRTESLALDFHPYVRISPGLGRILDKMLQPEAAKRFQSSQAVLEALDSLQSPRRMNLPVQAIKRALLAVAGVSLLVLGYQTVVPWLPKPPLAGPPIPAQATVPNSPVKTGGIWQNVGLANPQAIVEDTAGNIWIVGWSLLRLYPKGSLPGAQQWKSEDIFPPGETPSALAALPDGSVWVGSDKGSLRQYQAGQWHKVLSPSSQKIDFIGALKKKPFLVSSHTVWEMDGNNWRKAAALPAGSLKTVLATRSGDLLAGMGPQVLRLQDGKWLPLWEGTYAKQQIVESLHEQTDGSLLIGTQAGLYTRTQLGTIQGPELADYHIAAISPGRASQLWVGTQEAGFFFKVGDQWHPLGWSKGLPGDCLAQVKRSRYGQLWGGFCSEGVVMTREIQAIQRASKAAAAPLSAQTFANPCQAAGHLLADDPGPRMGPDPEVFARLTQAGPQVFFKGRLICPGNQETYLNASRSWLKVGYDWKHLTRYLIGKDSEQTLPPLQPEPKFYPQRGVVDERGWAWVYGLFSQELYVFKDQGWERIDQAAKKLWQENISVLASDDHGQVWVAATNRYKDSRPFIFRYDGLQWFPYSLPEGLNAYRTVAEILPLPDNQAAFASSSGLLLLKHNQLRLYERDQGLAYPYLHSLSRDQAGRLWLATSRGIAVFEPAAETFRFVHTRKGLFADNIKHIAHDASERIWLVAAKGQTAVYQAETLFKAADSTPE